MTENGHELRRATSQKIDKSGYAATAMTTGTCMCKS